MNGSVVGFHFRKGLYIWGLISGGRCIFRGYYMCAFQRLTTPPKGGPVTKHGGGVPAGPTPVLYFRAAMCIFFLVRVISRIGVRVTNHGPTHSMVRRYPLLCVMSDTYCIIYPLCIICKCSSPLCSPPCPSAAVTPSIFFVSLARALMFRGSSRIFSQADPLPQLHRTRHPPEGLAKRSLIRD